ncbi:MAG: hypothetical protein LBM95_04545 [Lactobacillales bacterium]|jgi:hypothetical protein|nr:hypothetical protein [Lactobacillales bacterium]
MILLECLMFALFVVLVVLFILIYRTESKIKGIKIRSDLRPEVKKKLYRNKLQEREKQKIAIFSSGVVLVFLLFSSYFLVVQVNSSMRKAKKELTHVQELNQLLDTKYHQFEESTILLYPSGGVALLSCDWNVLSDEHVTVRKKSSLESGITDKIAPYFRVFNPVVMIDVAALQVNLILFDNEDLYHNSVIEKNVRYFIEELASLSVIKSVHIVVNHQKLTDVETFIYTRNSYNQLSLETEQ